MVVPTTLKIYSNVRCILCLPLIILSISGCAVPYKVNITQNGSPKYDIVAIQYQTHSSREAFKSPESQQVKLVDFTSDKPKSDKPKGMTISSLLIQYPHPDGQEGIALATLKMSQTSFNSLFPKLNQETKQNPDNSYEESIPDLESINSLTQSLPSGKSSLIKEETWKFEFTKEQLDLLILDLSKSGFFDQQTRPNGKSHLSIQIDKGNLSKKWIQEPRLEDFINRIYEKGSLDSYKTERH